MICWVYVDIAYMTRNHISKLSQLVHLSFLWTPEAKPHFLKHSPPLFCQTPLFILPIYCLYGSLKPVCWWYVKYKSNCLSSYLFSRRDRMPVCSCLWPREEPERSAIGKAEHICLTRMVRMFLRTPCPSWHWMSSEALMLKVCQCWTESQNGRGWKGPLWVI